MGIYGFVSQEEIDDLPEDPQAAFIQFADHAHRSLQDKKVEIKFRNEADENNWKNICYLYVQTIIGAAEEYKIKELMNLYVPSASKFTMDDFLEFEGKLTRCTSKIVLSNAAHTRSDTVFIKEKNKDRIRSHLHHLKNCVVESALSAGKKAALIQKIVELEQELNKRRLSILKVMYVALGVMALPGGVWQSADAVHKLVTNVLEMVGEAKDVEDETRQLPPVQPPAALAPPTHGEESTIRPSDNDIDDEIPF